MEQKQYYEKFINKFVKFSKTINKIELYYRGTVKAVFDDKLILDDIYLGEIPLTFDGLGVISIGEK